MALFPYLLVIAIFSAAKLIPAVVSFLASTDLKIKWPGLYGNLLNSAGEKKKKVGSLFRTDKSGAHGFGLHRAEAILKAHGGWVTYNSEDGAFTSEFLVPAVR